LIILGIFRNDAPATAPAALILPAFSSSDTGILAVNRLRGLWKSLGLRSESISAEVLSHVSWESNRRLKLVHYSCSTMLCMACGARLPGRGGATWTCFWSSLLVRHLSRPTSVTVFVCNHGPQPCSSKYHGQDKIYCHLSIFDCTLKFPFGFIYLFLNTE
jgi:ribosomal protein L40E